MARIERAARLGHRVDRLPHIQATALPATGIRHDPAPAVRRYSEVKLGEELAKIKASTDSAENLLNVNNAAQTTLKADDTNESKKLTPYMTSLGLEVEFAQQSDVVPADKSAADVVLRGAADNHIDNAHIQIASATGLPLYTGIPFVLETDAGKALEFVTPPLLAPLQEGAQGATDVIPDPAWEKAAARALEFGIKRRVQAPVTIETFVDSVNADWPVELELSDDAYKPYVYGPIRKENAGSHTNAQVNYMTTLRHYADVNMAGAGGGDPETRKILTLLWEEGGLSTEFDGIEDQQALKAYTFVVSQKLREIQGSLNDYIFSKILAADKVAPQPNSVDEKAVNFSQQQYKTSTYTERNLLALEASKIKDKAQLWLKASYHQILQAVPDKYREPIVAAVGAKKDGILGLIVAATILPLSTSSMERYFKYINNPAALQTFLERWLDKALDNTSGAGLSSKARRDVTTRPKEQEEKAPSRLQIVGARPDTYVPADTSIAEESLFLVESRRATSYLGLKKTDRYRYQLALEQIDSEVEGADNQQNMREYFQLRTVQDEKALALKKNDLVKANTYLEQVTSEAKTLQVVEGEIGLDDSIDMGVRPKVVAYVQAGDAAFTSGKKLSVVGLLVKANEMYAVI